MKINRFFKINYYVQFRSNNQIRDWLETFWIWDAPVLSEWVYDKRIKTNSILNEDVIIEKIIKIKG